MPVWRADDLAADTDNDWDDPAAVEAHAHTGGPTTITTRGTGGGGSTAATDVSSTSCTSISAFPTPSPLPRRSAPKGLARMSTAGVGRVARGAALVSRCRRARADARRDPLRGELARADYLQGSDESLGPFVFVAGRFAFSLDGPGDYGGEHWNSTVLSHAFHLPIESGSNRTTGVSVEGSAKPAVARSSASSSGR